MPHDLFGDVAARPAADRSRRSPLVLLSVCLHGGALIAAIVASIVAPDVIPFPRQVLAFHEPVNARLVDIDLPSPPRRIVSARLAAAASSSVAAPLVAPSGIVEETGLENLPAPAPGDVAGVAGIVDAAGLGVVVSAPPPPPPPPAPPVRLHSGIRAPVKIVDAAPVYPPLARQSRIEGIVILETTIDAAGNIQDVRVLRSAAFFDQAAIDAVRQWRYQPATLNGQLVAVIMTLTIRFTLQ